jgi:hypothetical protein
MAVTTAADVVGTPGRMRRTIVLLAALVVALAAAPAPAHAASGQAPLHHTRSCPPASEINGPQRFIPGFGQYLESCIVHRHMRRLFKRCMVAFGLTAGGVGVGGLILQAAAKVISVEMITAGAGACINELVN